MKRSQCPVTARASWNAGSSRAASATSQTTPLTVATGKRRLRSATRASSFSRERPRIVTQKPRAAYTSARAFPRPSVAPTRITRFTPRRSPSESSQTRRSGSHALLLLVPIARHVEPERETRMRPERRVEARDARVLHGAAPEPQNRDLLSRPGIEAQLAVPAEQPPQRVGGIRAEAFLGANLLLDILVRTLRILPALEVQLSGSDAPRERGEIRRPVAPLRGREGARGQFRDEGRIRKSPAAIEAIDQVSHHELRQAPGAVRRREDLHGVLEERG